MRSWTCSVCGMEGREPRKYWLNGSWSSYCANPHCDQMKFVVEPTPEEEAWLLLKRGLR